MKKIKKRSNFIEMKWRTKIIAIDYQAFMQV